MKANEYYLIREDIENEYIEFFDFQDMIFKNIVTRGVNLDTIDSLTTFFGSDIEFTNYIDNINDNEIEYHYTYKIIHKSNNKKEEKILNVIWNDVTLNSISKLADSKVDFSIDYNYYTLYEIIKKIKDSKSGLATKILKAKKESTKLNEKNKEIISLIVKTKKELSFKELLNMFSDYKEYRALYLNYKSDSEVDKNTFNEKLKQLKMSLKEE